MLNDLDFDRKITAIVQGWKKVGKLWGINLPLTKLFQIFPQKDCFGISIDV